MKFFFAITFFAVFALFQQVSWAADGGAIYKAKCAACHGINGQGTAMAPAFKGNAFIGESSMEEISDVIRYGRVGAAKKYKQFAIGMPRQSLSHDDVMAIVSYLKDLSGYGKAPVAIKSNENESSNRKNAISRVESDEETVAVYTIQLSEDGKDTCYGTVYATNGAPDAENLYSGGWGDWYYDFFEFDLSESPTDDQTVSATLYFYGNAPEGGADPEFQVHRITQSWTESGVTRSNNPASIFYKNFGPFHFGPFHVGAPLAWNKVDITDLYKDWKKGAYPNYGVKLVPTKNNHTGGSIASSDNFNKTIRPKLEIVYMPATKNASKRKDNLDQGTVAENAIYIPLTSLIYKDKNLSGFFSVRMAFSPDGKVFATKANDTVILWDVATGNILKTLERHRSRVWAVVFSPDGKVLVTFVNRQVIIWDVATGNKIKTLEVEMLNRDEGSAAFSPDGKVFAAGDKYNTTLWDVETWEMLRRIDQTAKGAMPHEVGSPIVSFSPDGNTLVTGGGRRSIIMWDVATGDKLKTLPVSSWGGVAFSPDGKTFASGSGKVALWDVATGNILKTLEDSYTKDLIAPFSPDGKVLATGGGRNVILWDVATGNKLKTLEGHTRGVWAVAFSPDGRKLLSVGDDVEIILWDTFGIYLGLSNNKNDIQQMEGERDRVLRGLFKPKGEFETQREYEERIRIAKIEEERLRKEYGELIREARDRAEKEMKERRSRPYPVTLEAKLGKYDADNEKIEADILENRVLINVPREKAMEISKRKDNVTVQGLIRYVNDEKAELMNAFLVDKATEEKFAFGRHTEAVMTASSQKAPPDLKIASLKLTEPSDNGILDAGEKGRLTVVLRNAGKGPAFGVSLTLEADKALKGLRLNEKGYIGQINPGEEKTVEADITALEDIQSADLNVKATLVESSGFDSQPLIISFKTKELIPPLLQVAKVDIEDADGRRVITKGKEAIVTLTVQNAGEGASRGVVITAEPGDANIKLYGDSTVKIGDLSPGESKKAVFSVAVTARYNGPKELPLHFNIKEERERFSVKPDMTFALNEEAPDVKVVKVEAREAPTARRENIEDINIPPVFSEEQKIIGDKDVAIVIGIERYRKLPRAEFSYNDAKTVKGYLKAMGFAERNIKFLVDEEATLSGINSSIGTWLPNRIKKDSRVFIYYSGHGSPDPATGEAYLMPHDGDPNYLKDTGYSLKKLYESLGKLDAAEVAVVMDSCFSGSGGRSVLAKGARPAVVVIEDPVLASRNIAVLSSTQGAQISTFFAEKEHGLFTYYFLKAVKEGKKDIAEIYNYIKPLVEDEARAQNVEQSPSLKPGPELVKDRFGLRR